MDVEIHVMLTDNEWDGLLERHQGWSDETVRSFLASLDPKWLIEHAHRAEVTDPEGGYVGRDTLLDALDDRGDVSSSRRETLDVLVARDDVERVVLTIPPTAGVRLDHPTRLTVARDPEATDDAGRAVYVFGIEELRDAGPVVVFDGTVGAPAAGPEPDVETMAFTALNFATARPGDVDDDYFEDYSPEAVDWRDRCAEGLANLVGDYQLLRDGSLDERAGTAAGLDDIEAAAVVTLLHDLVWEPEWFSADATLTATAHRIAAQLTGSTTAAETTGAAAGDSPTHPGHMDSGLQAATSAHGLVSAAGPAQRQSGTYQGTAPGSGAGVVRAQIEAPAAGFEAVVDRQRLTEAGVTDKVLAWAEEFLVSQGHLMAEVGQPWGGGARARASETLRSHTGAPWGTTNLVIECLAHRHRPGPREAGPAGTSDPPVASVRDRLAQAATASRESGRAGGRVEPPGAGRGCAR